MKWFTMHILCITAVTILYAPTHARIKKCTPSCYRPCGARQHSCSRIYRQPIIKQPIRTSGTQATSPEHAEQGSMELLMKQIKNKEPHDTLLKTAQTVRSNRREIGRATATAPLDAQYRDTTMSGEAVSCPEGNCGPVRKIRLHRQRCMTYCRPWCSRPGQAQGPLPHS